MEARPDPKERFPQFGATLLCSSLYLPHHNLCRCHLFQRSFGRKMADTRAGVRNESCVVFEFHRVQSCRLNAVICCDSTDEDSLDIMFAQDSFESFSTLSVFETLKGRVAVV